MVKRLMTIVVVKSLVMDSLRRYVYVYILLFLFFPLVSAKTGEKIIIDLNQMEEGDIPLSCLVSKIEYVPLELTKECPMSTVFNIYVTSRYILTVGGGCIYMFDKEDGHFIKEISGRGNGPDEYISTLIFYSFDADRNIVYVDCRTKWREIDVLQNKCVKDIVKPLHRYEKENLYQGLISNPIYLHDNQYVGFTNNSTGKIKEKVVFFNEEGEVLKSFPNNVFHERISSDMPYNPALFYKYKKDLYLLPGRTSDTIFQVKEDNLLPHVVFKLGNEEKKIEYRTSTEIGDSPYTYEEKNDRIDIAFVDESDRYIFFTLCTGGPFSTKASCGYYNKKTKKAYRTPFTSWEKVGLKDDINGLLNFRFGNSLNGKSLVGWINPETLSDNYEMKRVKPLTEEGKRIAEQTKFDDNPVVVIATLK